MRKTSTSAGGDAVEISVVVVDDHPIIRDVTRRVLNEEADINVGADFSSVEDFLDVGVSADVVVLDLSRVIAALFVRAMVALIGALTVVLMGVPTRGRSLEEIASKTA